MYTYFKNPKKHIINEIKFLKCWRFKKELPVFNNCAHILKYINLSIHTYHIFINYTIF